MCQTSTPGVDHATFAYKRGTPDTVYNAKLREIIRNFSA